MIGEPRDIRWIDPAPIDDRAVDHVSAPRLRDDVLPVVFWLAIGLALLSVGRSIPPLWPRGTSAQVNFPLAFTVNGLVGLGVVFLPVWARSWKTAVLNTLGTMVLVRLAGSVAGAEPHIATALQLKLLGAFGSISTIWGVLRFSPVIRRFCWLALILWTLGLPAGAYLTADYGSDQGWASTLLHFSFASLLQ